MSVYFAQAGAYVKIGYSRRPISRVSTVTTAGKRPNDLPRGTDARLLGWVPGDQWVESAWHARFIASRVAGEWFYLDPEAIRQEIWADPCGVDFERMSARAVLAADRHPGISREEIAAAGIPVEVVPFDERDFGEFDFLQRKERAA